MSSIGIGDGGHRRISVEGRDRVKLGSGEVSQLPRSSERVNATIVHRLTKYGRYAVGVLHVADGIRWSIGCQGVG